MNSIMSEPRLDRGDKGWMTIVENYWSPLSSRIRIESEKRESRRISNHLYYPLLLHYEGDLWI